LPAGEQETKVEKIIVKESLEED
jgi:regulator of replication initiation timing